MSNRQLARSVARAATAAQETALHTSATLGARLPLFAAHAISPTAEGIAEWSRAWTEKVTAMNEGLFAATMAWQRMAIQSAFRMPTPTAFANDMMKLAHVAGHPARKAVKANARRLNKSRSKE